MNYEALNTVLSLSLAEIAAWQVHRLLDPAFGVGAEPSCIARLPALQRGAVWKQDQVELLWDSILRQFPIGALVLTPKLQNQGERLGRHSDQRWIETLNPTHHLLDGQQRSNAIALGFYDPFHSEVTPEEDHRQRAILWLDLTAPSAASTRHFLFRLTTPAHPWGFRKDDTARPLEARNMRKALVSYGWREEDNTLIKSGRPTPRDAWPFDAEAPMPFAWLLQAAIRAKNEAELRGELLRRCNATSLPWCDGVIAMLQGPIDLEQLFAALKSSLAIRVAALIVPDQAFNGRAVQGVSESQDIAAVEHLFQRLNAGGTVPNAEEMAYSMIKAYWPEVEKPISDLPERRMPEARLFMLGARVAMGAASKLNRGSNLSGRLPDSPSLEAVRRIGKNVRDEGTEAKRIHDFFTTAISELGHPPLLHLVMDQVKAWLEGGKDGVPPMLHSSIAYRSPEVYLLLMWMARRWISKGLTQPANDMCQHIVGIATMLHWFRPRDPAMAVKLIGEELDQKSWDGPDMFRGLLSVVASREEPSCGLLIPPTPHELMRIVGAVPDNKELKNWAWWKLARDAQTSNETAETRSVMVVKGNKELLMYAQRDYTRSFNFDPAHASADQHSRPWDYDHIIPRSKVAGKHKETRPGLLEWMDSIANLRVWPMEENRSNQADSPKSKMMCPKTGVLNQKALGDSFLTMEELDAFDLGCRNPFESENAREFLAAARRRFERIYSEWYYTLDVEFLMAAE